MRLGVMEARGRAERKLERRRAGGVVSVMTARA